MNYSLLILTVDKDHQILYPSINPTNSIYIYIYQMNHQFILNPPARPPIPRISELTGTWCSPRCVRTASPWATLPRSWGFQRRKWMMMVNHDFTNQKSGWKVDLTFENHGFTVKHDKHTQTWCFKPQEISNMCIWICHALSFQHDQPRSWGFNGPISMTPTQCLDLPLWLVKIRPYSALSIHVFLVEPLIFDLKNEVEPPFLLVLHGSTHLRLILCNDDKQPRQELCGDEDVVLAAVKQNGMALQTLGRLCGSFERDWWRGGGLCQICHKQVTHIVCPQRYAYNLERERGR